MDYLKYSFKTDLKDTEVLIALLSLEPFDTFVENENGFDAFLPAAFQDASIEENINALQNRFTFSCETEFIQSQNWNEEWESNFHPIQVDDFCGLRAEFHDPMEGVEHELVITPKMAFGTGHHETTFMVIQLMRGINFTNQKVLDFGCGTGVLAILASKLGASSIDAIDIEEASWQNTVENCETNEVKNVNALRGEIGIVGSNSYGIVLANINRNVILGSLSTLSRLIHPGGTMVLSGIMKQDEIILLEALEINGFMAIKIVEKNNWLAMQCART